MLLDVGDVFLKDSISPVDPLEPYLDREDVGVSDTADVDDCRRNLLTPLEPAPEFKDEDLETENSNLAAVSLEIPLSLVELFSLRDEYGL